MTLKFQNNNDIVLASICGEIDHHNAKNIREEIDQIIDRSQPKKLVLDFKEVGFMDSSGIGLVMGRYKNMKQINGELCVINISNQMKRIMLLGGLDRLNIIQR